MNEQRTDSHLTFLDKVFPALILLCMAAGLALGKVAPRVGHTLEPLLSLGLFLMIYPTVTKVPFRALRRSALEGRPAILSIVLNHFVNPLLLFAFGWLFLRNYPDLWTGLILLGIAPCIGMVLVWWVASYCGLLHPQRVAISVKGEQWFRERLTPVLGKIQLSALLATLVVMFALKGEVILNAPHLIAYMVLPLALFFLTLFSIGILSACLVMRLPMDKSVTVGFHVTGRNFELSIALALSAFAASPMVAVSTIIGPLIEVPVMLSLAWVGRRLVERFPLCCVSARADIVLRGNAA